MRRPSHSSDIFGGCCVICLSGFDSYQIAAFAGYSVKPDFSFLCRFPIFVPVLVPDFFRRALQSNSRSMCDGFFFFSALWLDWVTLRRLPRNEQQQKASSRSHIRLKGYNYCFSCTKRSVRLYRKPSSFTLPAIFFRKAGKNDEAGAIRKEPGVRCGLTILRSEALDKVLNHAVGSFDCRLLYKVCNIV